MSGDGYHFTSPDHRGRAFSMQRALEDARLLPESVDYINAHGKSTVYNDKIETLAIKSSLAIMLIK